MTSSSGPSSPTLAKPPTCCRPACPTPSETASTFDKLRWTTLTLVDGTFLDDDLRESQSDLLYRVEHVETGQPVSLYLLFEHLAGPLDALSAAEVLLPHLGGRVQG